MKLIVNTGGRLRALGREELAKAAEKIPGGLAHGKPDSEFDAGKLSQGAQVEREHTSDEAVAREIAKDHLTEDPNYYQKLKRMEAEKPMKKGELTPKKARQILHDKEVHGHPLTEKQRRYMGAVASGSARKSESAKAEEPDGAVRERADEATKQPVKAPPPAPAAPPGGGGMPPMGKAVEDMDPIDAVKADMRDNAMRKAFPPKKSQPPKPPGSSEDHEPGKPPPPPQPAKAALPANPAAPAAPGMPAKPAAPAEAAGPTMPGVKQQPPAPMPPGPGMGMPPAMPPAGPPPKPQPEIPGVPPVTPLGTNGGQGREGPIGGLSSKEAVNERFNDSREFFNKYMRIPAKDHWDLIDMLREQDHHDLANAHEALMRHKVDGDHAHLHKVTEHLRTHYYGKGPEKADSTTGGVEQLDGEEGEPGGDEQKIPQVRSMAEQGEVGLEAQRHPDVPENAQPHETEHQDESGESQISGPTGHEGMPGGEPKLTKNPTHPPAPNAQGEVGDHLPPPKQPKAGLGEASPGAKPPAKAMGMPKTAGIDALDKFAAGEVAKPDSPKKPVSPNGETEHQQKPGSKPFPPKGQPEDDEEKKKLAFQKSQGSLSKRLPGGLAGTGEGSRGGHVIGHTASGKPIYGELREEHGGHHESEGKRKLEEALNRRLGHQVVPFSKAEGERGGRVIGRTRTGKPIYESHGHESHGSFTPEEHADAWNAHRQAASQAFHQRMSPQITAEQGRQLDQQMRTHGAGIKHHYQMAQGGQGQVQKAFRGLENVYDHLRKSQRTRGLDNLGDYLRKARNVTPIGGITPGGYRKVDEDTYVKEEPGAGKQLGLFGGKPEAAKPAAHEAMGYRHLSDAELQEGIKQQQAKHQAKKDAGNHVAAEGHRQIMGHLQAEVDRRQQEGSQRAAPPSDADKKYRDKLGEAERLSDATGATSPSIKHFQAAKAHLRARDAARAAGRTQDADYHDGKGRAHHDQYVRMAGHEGVKTIYDFEDPKMAPATAVRREAEKPGKRMSEYARRVVREAEEQAKYTERAVGTGRAAQSHQAAARAYWLAADALQDEGRTEESDKYRAKAREHKEKWLEAEHESTKQSAKFVQDVPSASPDAHEAHRKAGLAYSAADAEADHAATFGASAAEKAALYRKAQHAAEAALKTARAAAHPTHVEYYERKVAENKKHADTYEAEAKPAETPKAEAPKAKGLDKPYSAGDVVSGDAPYKVGDVLGAHHTSPETAYVVDDYPYGRRVRTQKRYWIESNKNGQRVMTQTKNPRTGQWNKPDASTYELVQLLKFDEKGHLVHGGGLHAHAKLEAFDKIMKEHPEHIANLPAEKQTEVKRFRRYQELMAGGMPYDQALKESFKEHIPEMAAQAKEAAGKKKEAQAAKKEARAAGPTGPAPEMPEFGGVPLPTPEAVSKMSEKELRDRYGNDWGDHSRMSYLYAKTAKKAAAAGHHDLATQLKHLATMHKHFVYRESPTAMDAHKKLKAHVEKTRKPTELEAKVRAKTKEQYGTEKSMTGIENLAKYAEDTMRKADLYEGMPEGESEIPQENANGGQGLEDGGSVAVKKAESKGSKESGTDYADTYGDAPKAEEDELSDDDAPADKQMKPHKKPIEEATEKSLSPARQRDLTAHERAAQVAQLRKSRDIHLHPLSEARLHAGTEDRVERLLSKSEAYVEDPTLAPAMPIISQGVLCKSCGCRHTAAVTACPSCGAGTVVNEVMPGVPVTGQGVLQKSKTPVLRPAKRQGDMRFDGGNIPLEE